MARRLVAAAAAILAVPAFAAHPRSQYCPTSDICFELNIPEQTARTGSGDIYFQISGATAYSWIGLGQGSRMGGANIFIVYADGHGNVTISPRLGVGQVEPVHDTATHVALLEGSGVRDGKMIANVLCRNCESWQGGTMDFSDPSANWIWASKSGDAVDSSSADESIVQHNNNGNFAWDFTAAQGGRNVNPFVTTDGKPVAPPAASSSPSSSSSQPGEVSNRVIVVHASLATIAFLALFPIGSLLLRMPGLRHAIWIHAATQTLAYVVFIAGAGVGIYAAVVQDELKDAHPIIGMLLLGLLFFQPWSGFFHHLAYRKHKMRTAISHVHLWKGRILILLGMINGGLGLELNGLRGPHPGYFTAYIVVAAVMGTLFIANIVYGEVVRSRRKNQKSSPADTSSEAGFPTDK